MSFHPGSRALHQPDLRGDERAEQRVRGAQQAHRGQQLGRARRGLGQRRHTRARPVQRECTAVSHTDQSLYTLHGGTVAWPLHYTLHYRVVYALLYLCILRCQGTTSRYTG